jgi:hypothetical protein
LGGFCCEPVGDYVNEQVNGLAWMCCAETDDEARQYGLAAAQQFIERVAREQGE